MKSVSSKSVIGFLARTNSIFNLSAPGAAKLENPFALSYKEVSSFAATSVSTTCKPTLYVLSFVYWSNISVCSLTLTKLPLTK